MKKHICSDCKRPFTPAEYAVYRLRKMGILITKQELIIMLKKVKKEMNKKS